MAGVAVEVANNTQSLAEHGNWQAAAGLAGAYYFEPTTGACGLKCVHADWRTSQTSYTGGYAH